MAGETKDPKCPECLTTPLRFNYSNQVVPDGAVIALLWCADCGHVFTLTQIGQRPMIAPVLSSETKKLNDFIKGHG
jgi:hypothetical protein